MYTNIFDSHAHYDDPAFDEDRHTLLPELHQQGVSTILNVGANLPRSEQCIALAEQYPFVYAAVGIHPCDVKDSPADYLQALTTLAQQQKVVAIGEIGLDYHYEDNAPKAVQLAFFEAQLQLANEYSLPVIVHDREAHADTLTLLQKHRPRGVVHCFSGSVEMATEIIKLGMHIGLGGAVTFKNAKTAPTVAAAIPLERLLLETDAPYMAPVPHRGHRCHSGMIAETAAHIANLRQMPVQDLLNATAQNAHTLFLSQITS